LIGYSWKFLGRLGDQRDGLGIEERDLQEREMKMMGNPLLLTTGETIMRRTFCFLY
jgi:hypothetical protein